MPLYEFSCVKCSTEFEELVRSSQPEALAEVSCPACGSRKVKKKVSAFAASVSSGGHTASASCAPSGGG